MTSRSTARSARRRAEESSFLEEPESLGTRTRGVFTAGGTTMMLDGLGVELALGVAGTQLFVPVFSEEPVARRA